MGPDPAQRGRGGPLLNFGTPLPISGTAEAITIEIPYIC